MERSLKIDNEFRDLIPPLRLDERRVGPAFSRTVTATSVWSGTVIDGHNRYEICTRLCVPFEVVEKEFDSKVTPLSGFAAIN